MTAFTAVPTFRGRESELAALGDTLDRMTSGRLTVAIVEGEAGIGKTRLLAEALAAARNRNVQVHAARAEELERTRPFGVLADALGCSRSSPDPPRAALAELLTPRAGEHGPITVSSDAGLRFQAVDAFVDLVETLALREPVVIGLDDLQWADPSSLLTLGGLARRLTHLPVAIICCLRPSPRVEELGLALEALDAAEARRLTLGPLDKRAVVDLVTDAVAAEPGRRLLEEMAGARGNPLFLTELLAAIKQEGAVRTVDGHAEVEQASLPPTLRLTILRRLSFLPDDTLEALRPASILGSSFSVLDLSTTTTRSVLDLSAVLGSAVDASVLEDAGDRLRFRHDLIRDAVYEDLPESVRLALHREAGQRLARSGAPALQVAGQLARGAAPGDAEAISWLTKAAREVAPGSPRVAADLLQHAIELTDRFDPARDQLITERGVSLMWAGHLQDAEAACRSLLEREHDALVDGPARASLAQMLIARGRASDALVQLAAVHRSGLLTDAERASAWGWTAIAYWSLADLDHAAAAAGKAMTAAAAADDAVMTSLAMCSLATVGEMRAELSDALRTADDAVRLADQSPQRVGHRYPVHLCRGRILLGLDRLPEARDTLKTGIRINEELGMRGMLPSYQTSLAVERFLTGEWDDAVAEFETGLELADEIGDSYSLIHGLSVMALIALHRGDLRKAETAAEAAADELAATGPRYRSHWLTWVRALLLEARDDIPQAFAVLFECWSECSRCGLAIEYPVFGPDLVRLALALGERERAEQVAAAVTDLATTQNAPPITGAAALRCRGLLAGDSDTLRAAADRYTAAGRPLQTALAHEEAATMLARDGAVDSAATLLDRALTTFERLGAARDVARAEARLRELGIRRGRRGSRKRPALGWRSLTPTEQSIVDLVAEGLSNPQIGDRLYVSRRTVQTHLSHVFAKLAISSRAQLAAEVSRH